MMELVYIQYVALVFAAVLGLLWLVFKSSSKAPQKPKEKSKIFACGMDIPPDSLNVPQQSYFSYIRRFLRTQALSDAHSGKLSSYVSWIIAGLAIIIAIMVIMW